MMVIAYLQYSTSAEPDRPDSLAWDRTGTSRWRAAGPSRSLAHAIAASYVSSPALRWDFLLCPPTGRGLPRTRTKQCGVCRISHTRCISTFHCPCGSESRHDVIPRTVPGQFGSWTSTTCDYPIRRSGTADGEPKGHVVGQSLRSVDVGGCTCSC